VIGWVTYVRTVRRESLLERTEQNRTEQNRRCRYLAVTHTALTLATSVRPLLNQSINHLIRNRASMVLVAGSW